MIKKNLILILFGVVVAFSSCKKESDKDPIDAALEAEYNDASADDNKANIESNGIDFSDEMKDMKDLDAIQIAINLGSMMGKDDIMSKSSAMNKGMTPIKILSSIGKKTTSSMTISDGLKSASEDPENLEEAWDMIVGTYEYNFTTEEFDKTEEGGDEVIVEFPGLETDKTNTAELKINDFEYFEVTKPIYSGDEEDISLVGQQLPTSIHTQLSYKGDVLFTWDFSASYESNGIPTSLNSVLTVEPYSISVTLTHDPYSNATSKFSFKNESKILLETYAAMNGDWSEENIEDFDEDDAEFENIINNANAYFQVLNIKVAGKVDFKTIVPAIRDLEEKLSDEDITQKEYAKGMVEIINDNAKLVVVTADDNKMIAKAEVYTYYDDEDNYWAPAVNFVFGDGSKIDAETYIASDDYKEDFGGLIDEINDMIDEFNSENDTDIDNIE